MSSNSHRADDHMTLERWIVLAAAGDHQAFAALYRHHVDGVYGLCLRMTGNVADAEDATQQAFINAWRKLAQFRQQSLFKTWLHRIAVNEVLAKQRKLTLVDQSLQDIPEPTSEPFNHDQTLELAIAQLSERPRQVFVLHAVYGYSQKETAALLRIAVGTVKAHYHNARQQLQGSLGGSSD